MKASDRDHEAGRVSAIGAPAASPRICMPTWRGFTRKAFRCGMYEAQDVLAEIDDVDVIELEMAWAARIREPWLRLPLYHDITKKFIYANPGLRKVRLAKEYEAFVAVCNTYWDLPYINAIERWRDHCRVSVCWIDEMWAAAIPGYKYWLDALKQFDYVFTGFKESAATLSRVTNRPCYWLPGGVDAIRFCPYPDPPARVVDLYSIGRRHKDIHRAILWSARRGETFYIHDTLAAADAQVYHQGEHREMYANIAKRSRCFLVTAAKMNAPVETQGQIEIGYRYFEGAGAGTVMIGEVPDCNSYRELFDWPEAVVPIKADGSDIRAVLRELASDRDRVAAISARNITASLLRHDWAHRWAEMFRVAGIERSPRLSAREERLNHLADLACGATGAAVEQARVSCTR